MSKQILFNNNIYHEVSPRIAEHLYNHYFEVLEVYQKGGSEKIFTFLTKKAYGDRKFTYNKSYNYFLKDNIYKECFRKV